MARNIKLWAYVGTYSNFIKRLGNESTAAEKLYFYGKKINFANFDKSVYSLLFRNFNYMDGFQIFDRIHTYDNLRDSDIMNLMRVAFVKAYECTPTELINKYF